MRLDKGIVLVLIQQRETHALWREFKLGQEVPDLLVLKTKKK